MFMLEYNFIEQFYLTNSQIRKNYKKNMLRTTLRRYGISDV